MRRRRAVFPVVLVAAATAAMWSTLASTTAPARSEPASSLPAESSPGAGITESTRPSGRAATKNVDATATTLAPVTHAPTTTVPATTIAVPTLLVPSRVPADPYADVPVVPLGRIQIPAIGLDHVLYEGVWLTVINEGPGHWPGTPLPGGYGNSVFGGHRVTYTHPFRDVDQLVAGDAVQFTLVDGRRFVYRVTDQFIVEPDALWIVDQAPGRTLTLFACHPKGSARQRIVIRAELASAVSLSLPSG